MSFSVQEKLEAGPLFDNAIVGHGFTPSMRDYNLFVNVFGSHQDGTGGSSAGQCRYRFTHCVLAEVTTAMSDSTWQQSWSDTLLDYSTWQEAGEPLQEAGYVWGVNFLGAYPGLTYRDASDAAREWSGRLAHPMHEVFIETNVQNIRLIFHDVEITVSSEGSFTE